MRPVNRFALSLCCLLFFALSLAAVHAQDAASGTDVSVQATDGRTLYGTYYAGQGRAVLLLHELYTNRTSWEPLIQPLLDSGMAVLTVDLRGYGQTKGKINWSVAQDDTTIWAAWLAAQSGVSSIVMVGSSMGANLALNGCAAVEGCAGAVAISPGLNYFGVRTRDALADGFPALLVYADRDAYPRKDVPDMLEIGAGHAEALTFEGREHGMDLFAAHSDLAGTLTAWLAAH